MFFDDLEDVSYMSLPTQAKLLDTVNMSSYDESWLSPNASFPQKLFAMSLHEFDSMGKGIEWCASGTAFRVKDPESFAEDVLPKYFKHSKVTSFQRQLNLYGFRRITKGDDFGAYFHASFLRGRDDLVQNIRRFPTNKSMSMCMEGMMNKDHVDEKHPIYTSESSSSSSGASTTTSVGGLVRKLDTTVKVGGQGLPTTPLSSGSTATESLSKRRSNGNDIPVRASTTNGNGNDGFVGKMDHNRESISGDSLSKIFDVYLWEPTDMVVPSSIVEGERSISAPISSPTTYELNLSEKNKRPSIGSSGKGMDIDDNDNTRANPTFPSQEQFMDELMVIEDVAA